MKKSLLLFVFAFLLQITLFAQDGLIPLRPEPAQFVNDYAELIPADKEAILERKLLDFDKQTTHQFAVVILPSLKGNNLEKLANQWFKAWGIGQKDKNNGVLILVAQEDRKMRIEVGYGLENTITNAEAQKVITTFLQPNFRNQEYYKGLDEATTYLIDLVQKSENQQTNASPSLQTPTSNEQSPTNESKNIDANIAVGLIVGGIVMVMCLLAIIFKQSITKSNSHSYSKSSSKSGTSYQNNNSDNTNTYTSGYVGYTDDSSSSSSSYDSSSSSSDSSSFGGGDSGGGGSSGDW